MKLFSKYFGQNSIFRLNMTILINIYKINILVKTTKIRKNMTILINIHEKKFLVKTDKFYLNYTERTQYKNARVRPKEINGNQANRHTFLSFSLALPLPIYVYRQRTEHSVKTITHFCHSLLCAHT